MKPSLSCAIAGPHSEWSEFCIIALGASTGGPGALVKILSSIGTDMRIPIVVVQHIEGSFIEGFITWLRTELKRPVAIAVEGEVIHDGVIYIAGACGNLELTVEHRFHYSPPSVGQLYTPNINHFFKSLAKLDMRAYAALLTGMGNDGAAGLTDLAERGWNTHVQAPDTCVVSGMPDSALKMSARHQVGTPEQIARYIQTYGLAAKRRNYDNPTQ